MATDSANGTGAVDHDSAVEHRKTLMGAVDFTFWIERLQRFMSKQPGFAGDVVVSNLSIPTAGGSSGTVLFDISHDAADGKRATRGGVLRHATQGGLFHSYDLSGQYLLLEALQESGVVVPAVMGLDADGAILGVPGYVMERVEGSTPPPTYYSRGVIVDASPHERRTMVRDVLGNLARLHALDVDGPGFAFLHQRGEGMTPAERDIDWYWASLTWGCPDALEEVAPARQWLLENQPPEMPVSVCHGDATLSNYMFRKGKVVAVLDWEMAFLGNPAHDVVFQYQAHRLLGLGSNGLDGMPDEAEWKAAYEEISQTRLMHWDYCAAVTAYKMHVVLLLVYREPAPGMEAVRDIVLNHTRQTLVDRLEVARQVR